MTERSQELHHRASPPRIHLGVDWIYPAAAVLLLLALPFAGVHRSPGGISLGWWICMTGDAALLAFTAIRLNPRLGSSLKRRLLLYSSLGVGVGVAITLAVIWYTQQQFDYWAHRGISYF